jgi:hypothetical protein
MENPDSGKTFAIFAALGVFARNLFGLVND